MKRKVELRTVKVMRQHYDNINCPLSSKVVKCPALLNKDDNVVMNYCNQCTYSTDYRNGERPKYEKETSIKTPKEELEAFLATHKEIMPYIVYKEFNELIKKAEQWQRK